MSASKDHSGRKLGTFVLYVLSYKNRGCAVYHNIMMEPAKGKAAIRAAIGGYTDTSESVQFKVLASASVGNIVMNERVDTLVTKTGKKVDVPVAGVYEIKEGKISALARPFRHANSRQADGVARRSDISNGGEDRYLTNFVAHEPNADTGYDRRWIGADAQRRRSCAVPKATAGIFAA
jgi:limonene-1,2-epoxide hydrolase